MLVQAVSRYREPHYPTRDSQVLHGRTTSAIPCRWVGRATVLAAMAAAAALPLAMAAGCTDGAYGGDMSAAPTILTEAEARSAIVRQARECGLVFQETDREVVATYLGRSFHLKLDGFDAAHNVGYEYVSQADLAAASKALEITNDALVQKTLGDALKNAGSGMRVANLSTHEYEHRDDQFKHLGEQLREFVHWLKSEGVI